MNATARTCIHAAVIAVLLVVAIGWFAHYRAKSSVVRLKAELIAAGEKLSVEDQVLLVVPPAENGARKLLDAMAMLGSLDYKLQASSMSHVVPGRARIFWQQTNAATYESPDIWPALRSHHASNREPYLQLRAALESPSLQFSYNLSGGFSALLLPHLAQVKSAAQRLSTAVLLELHDGRPEEGLADLRALTAIPSRWRDEPTMISQLVRLAILSIASATTWEALQFTGWSDSQLAELQAMWESMPLGNVAQLGLSGERCLVLDEFERCRRNPSRLNDLTGLTSGTNLLEDLAEVGQKLIESPSDGFRLFLKRFPRQWMWKPWTSYHDEAWFLQSSHLHLEMSRAWNTRAPFAEMERDLEKQTTARGPVPEEYLVSSTGFQDSYKLFIRKAALSETQRRLVIVAIALRRFHKAHGTWPTKLEELVPSQLQAVPLDLMDAKPLRYRLTQEGEPLLYSVGTDGVDDGGKPEAASGGSKYWMLGLDIVWPQPASPGELEAHLKQLEAKRDKRQQ